MEKGKQARRSRAALMPGTVLIDGNPGQIDGFKTIMDRVK